jgi:hypothetical protein
MPLIRAEAGIQRHKYTELVSRLRGKERSIFA